MRWIGTVRRVPARSRRAPLSRIGTATRASSASLGRTRGSTSPRSMPAVSGVSSTRANAATGGWSQTATISARPIIAATARSGETTAAAPPTVSVATVRRKPASVPAWARVDDGVVWC